MSSTTLVRSMAWLVASLLLWYLLPFAYRLHREKQLGDRCRERRAIVLTYDDGPGERLTPDLLRLLNDRGVAATFFVLGRQVEALPELHRRLLAAGHEVGSHTFDHANAWRASPARYMKDMQRGISAIREHGGDVHLFRPPYGKLTLGALIDGLRNGLRFGWWTIDSGDSWRRRPISDVVAEIEERGGGVVLMHDFDEYDNDETGISHIDHVLNLTASLIDHADAHGYRLATLGDVLVRGTK